MCIFVVLGEGSDIVTESNIVELLRFEFKVVGGTSGSVHAERGEGVGKTVTLTVLPTEDEKGLAGSPMSGESQLALAVCDAPHFDGAVIQPSDELPSVCRAELEAGDAMAAIFSDVS